MVVVKQNEYNKKYIVVVVVVDTKYWESKK